MPRPRLRLFKTAEDRLLAAIDNLRAVNDGPQMDRHIHTLILLTIHAELATIRRALYVVVFGVVVLAVRALL